jgi:glucose-fructose oxidoreductase
MVQRRRAAAADRRRVRFGVVGLGHFAQVAILPAFANARSVAELGAIFSSDATKRTKLGRKYGVDYRFDYHEEFEEGLLAAGLDAVYIALPNHLHREYAVRAAELGVHVLTEKPMAVTERECREMIAACDRNGVKLMVAYRLHFEEANLRAVDLVQSGKIGEPRFFSSVFTMQVKDDNIRVNPRAMGGGSVYDIGVYCINAARYLLAAEPEAVVARSADNGDPRFAAEGVDEMTAATLVFPGERLAQFTVSFGAADVGGYRVMGTEGDLLVEPAYSYAEPLTHELTVKGRTRKRTFGKRDQIAPEIVHFAECVMSGEDPEPDGREGLADVRIVEAIYRSADAGGAPVRLAPFDKHDRPSLEQERRRPAHGKPEVVRAEAPHE